MTFKRAGLDGLFETEHAPLFDKILDDTTPQSRSSLIDQAFLTNAALGDPSTMAQPAAVNPVLDGPMKSISPTTPTSAASDEMGDGQGQRDVLAAYAEGRFAALEKYALATGSHLPATASKSTVARGTPVPKATMPKAPSASQQLTADAAARGTVVAQGHSEAFGTGEMTPAAVSATPATGPASPGASVNTASLFKATSGPGSQPPPAGQKRAAASLPVRSDYGVKEPTRYSIPPDNGAHYTPRTSLEEKGQSRSVSKAFNDTNIQRSADHLNEMGQASVGTIG